MSRKPKKRDPFAETCERLLAPLGPVEARRMFGGHGLFLEDLMIGLIADDFAAAGSAPFRYKKKERWFTMSFWRVPEGSLAGAKALLPWGERALAAARRNAATKTRRRPR